MRRRTDGILLCAQHGHRQCALCYYVCCDACVDPDALRSSRAAEPRVAAALAAIAGLPPTQQLIVDAVGSVTRRIGRLNLALALRGSRAKAVVAHGLEHLPHYGALSAASEDAVIATIDQLIRDRRLVRRGRKYPTVSLPAQRAARPRRDPSRRTRAARRHHALRSRNDYHLRIARELQWKAYMVFQRGVIAAIDKDRPASMDALLRIPGLGPAKIARFGDDLLAIVRRYGE